MNSFTIEQFLAHARGKEKKLVFISLGGGAAFFFMVAVLLNFPFKNYITCPGTFEYKNEVEVISETDGVVDKILKNNFDEIAQDQPLLECHLLLLQKYPMLSPASGKIYYNSDPLSLIGSYLRKGQIVAYIFNGDKKIAKVYASLNNVDMFNVGQQVILYYRNPHTLFSQKIESRVSDMYVDKDKDQVILFCDFDNKIMDLEQKYPGTLLKAKILINDRSLLKSLF